MRQLFLYYTALSTALILTNCTDPVAPQFRFETGFLLVDGRIAGGAGYSQVQISRSEILFGQYTLVPQRAARVSSLDEDGMETLWTEVDSTGEYRPPENWAATTGKTYHIRIVTSEGETIESEPERIPASVPIAAARVSFDQEAYFSDGRNRFVPAFTLLIDVDDPGGVENFYRYRYTAFEIIQVCATCERSRWRNGECIPGPDTRFVERWDYLCDATCWVANTGRDINLLSDALSDGRRISGFTAGRFDYRRPGGLLFDVQQYSVSEASYAYSSVIQELAEGSGGLNAPLPAALVGNLSDLSENKTNVLGFISGVGVANERVYIVRDTVDGDPIDYNPNIRLEPALPAPPAAPCEGGNRTRVMPTGWGG